MRSAEEVYQLLQQLETRTAEELEDEDLELKPWEPDPKRRLRVLREYVVCLANGRGGTIVLGVRERTRGITQAIEGIGEYDATPLRRGIYDGTDPHVLVELQELPIAGKGVLLVHVPRGIPPHTTSEGLAKIRVGKDCQPLTGQCSCACWPQEGNETQLPSRWLGWGLTISIHAKSMT
jgi:ATP-dependent DNA helicase RecG